MEEGPVGGFVNLFLNWRGVECGCIGDPELIEGDELSWEGIEGKNPQDLNRFPARGLSGYFFMSPYDVQFLNSSSERVCP